MYLVRAFSTFSGGSPWACIASAITSPRRARAVAIGDRETPRPRAFVVRRPLGKLAQIADDLVGNWRGPCRRACWCGGDESGRQLEVGRLHATIIAARMRRSGLALVPNVGTATLSEDVPRCDSASRHECEGDQQMSFDGEAFVDEMRDELDRRRVARSTRRVGGTGRARRGHQGRPRRLGPPALPRRHVSHPSVPLDLARDGFPTR